MHHLPNLLINSRKEQDENHYHRKEIVGDGCGHATQKPGYIFQRFWISPPSDEKVLTQDHEQKEKARDNLVYDEKLF